MDILLIVFGTLLSILFFAQLEALYKVLGLLKQIHERKSLPLPRNKIDLVENLAALESMSNSELMDLQLFLTQGQKRLDAILKYQEDERGLVYALRNEKSVSENKSK